MSLGDRAVLRALAHPVRMQIMSLLTGASLTAADVARELGLTHANASYHVRNLAAAGLIQPAGEERIRGGVAKRYRYDPDRDRRKQNPTEGESKALYQAVASELIRRTALAEWSGRKMMADAELWLEPDVWLELRDRISAVAKDLHKAAQPPRTPGTIRTSTSLAMFQMEADS